VPPLHLSWVADLGGWWDGTDQADDSAANAIIKATRRKFARIDILVNNAGIGPGAIRPDSRQRPSNFGRSHPISGAAWLPSTQPLRASEAGKIPAAAPPTRTKFGAMPIIKTPLIQPRSPSRVPRRHRAPFPTSHAESRVGSSDCPEHCRGAA
jgi:hypothetical protein